MTLAISVFGQILPLQNRSIVLRINENELDDQLQAADDAIAVFVKKVGKRVSKP